MDEHAPLVVNAPAPSAAVRAPVGAAGRSYSDAVRDAVARLRWHHTVGAVVLLALGYIVYRVSV